MHIDGRRGRGILVPSRHCRPQNWSSKSRRDRKSDCTGLQFVSIVTSNAILDPRRRYAISRTSSRLSASESTKHRKCGRAHELKIFNRLLAECLSAIEGRLYTAPHAARPERRAARAKARGCQASASVEDRERRNANESHETSKRIYFDQQKT